MGRGIRSSVKGLRRVTAEAITEPITADQQTTQIGGGMDKQLGDPHALRHVAPLDHRRLETNLSISCSPKNHTVTTTAVVENEKYHSTNQNNKRTDQDDLMDEIEKVGGNLDVIYNKNVKDPKGTESMSFSVDEETAETQLAASSSKGKRKNVSSEAMKEAAHVVAKEIKSSFALLSQSIANISDKEIYERQKGLNGEFELCSFFC